MDSTAPGYMICTAPRSGSTLLCTLLRGTGMAGWPESYFHGPTLSRWAAALDLPKDAGFADILEKARCAGRSGGAVFGLRQQWPSFPLLLDALSAERSEPTDRLRLESALGPLRYIHLTRPDKLAQALSYIRAEQTGIWHRNTDGGIYEEQEPKRPDGYDAAAIKAQILAFERYDAHWRAWFEAQEIAPLAITYDALADAPTATLSRVLGWIGLDPRGADHLHAPTRKLADAVSAEWSARYRAETGYGIG